MSVTADTLLYNADNSTWPTADGYLPTNIISAEVVEPVRAGVTADTAAYTADNTIWPTADGGISIGALDTADADVIAAGTAVLVEAADASDSLDAQLIPAIVVIGGRYRAPLRPLPVVGYGYGILPELEGEAHGMVGVSADAFATLSIVGAATGATGAVATAVGVVKNLSIIGEGVAGTRGSGSGVIALKLNATALGRYDDDEIAVMTFLLAA